MAYSSGLLINQSRNEHCQTQCCATTTQKTKSNTKKTQTSLVTHILFPVERTFPMVGIEEKRATYSKFPKAKTSEQKANFISVLSLVESWTCLPATNLTLSFKLHLTLGWGRGKRASAQIPRVWKMETLTRIRNFSMTALAADSFACLSIIKLSSLKSERQTSRDGLDLGDNC